MDKSDANPDSGVSKHNDHKQTSAGAKKQWPAKPKAGGITAAEGKWRKLCGSRTKNTGQPCQNPAMENGRCRMHGGKAVRGAAHPDFTHGGTSKYLPTRLLARAQESLDNPDQLSMKHELAAIDARLAELYSHLDVMGSGDSWVEAKNLVREFAEARDAKPQQTKKMAAAFRRLERVVLEGTNDSQVWEEISRLHNERRKIIDTETRRLTQMQQMVSAEQVVGILTAFVNSVGQVVKDQRVMLEINTIFQRTINLPERT